jgi:hypothetical protein
MKICWNYLEKIRITRDGNFKLGSNIYYEYDACLECGESYLGLKNNNGHCSRKCGTIGDNNGMYGKLRSDLSKLNQSVKMAGKRNPMYGIKKMGEENPNYKGGVVSKNIPLYNTYKHQLEPMEQCAHDPEYPTILNVFCVNCGVQYRPTLKAVNTRIYKGFKNDTCKFYCSIECKKSCSIYGKRAHPKDNKSHHYRVHQKEWALLVLEQNNNEHICEICGEYGNIAHHIDPVVCNPIESADIDNGIIVCERCHKNIVHKLPGCTIIDLLKHKH